MQFSIHGFMDTRRRHERWLHKYSCECDRWLTKQRRAEGKTRKVHKWPTTSTTIINAFTTRIVFDFVRLLNASINFCCIVFNETTSVGLCAWARKRETRSKSPQWKRNVINCLLLSSRALEMLLRRCKCVAWYGNDTCVHIQWSWYGLESRASERARTHFYRWDAIWVDNSSSKIHLLPNNFDAVN